MVSNVQKKKTMDKRLDRSEKWKKISFCKNKRKQKENKQFKIVWTNLEKNYRFLQDKRIFQNSLKKLSFFIGSLSLFDALLMTDA